MIVETFIKELQKDNISVIVYPLGQGTVNANTINNLIQNKCGGFISFLLLDELAYLRTQLFRLPGLIFGRKQEVDGLSCVYMDDYAGGRLAAEYLIKKSINKKFIYIGNDTIECNERRFNGFESKLNELGLTDIQYMAMDDIAPSLNDYIDKGYDCIFAFDDALVNIVYKTAKKHIDVVGFNGTSEFYSNYLSYPSVDADYGAMVLEAKRIIVESIANPDFKPVSVMFDTRLMDLL